MTGRRGTSGLLIVPALLVCAAVSNAAPPEPPPASPVQAPPASRRGAAVARVNGVAIYQSDLDTAISSFARANGLTEPIDEARRKEIRQSILDGLIGTELLYQRAVALKVELPQTQVEETLRQTRDSMGAEAVQQEMERRGMTDADLAALVRQNLLVQKMIKETVIDPLVVPEAEIRRFYDEHPDQMRRPAGLEASHILVRWTQADGPEKRELARRRIEQALARAKAGENFATLAKEFSEDESGKEGGALGTIYQGQTVPAFEEAAFKLASGEISPVVETPFGFHLIKAGDRRPEGTASLEEVRGPVSDYLRQQRSQDAIERLVGELRAAAKIEIL